MSRAQIISQLRASGGPQLTIGTLTTEDQDAAIQILREGSIPFLHVDVMDGVIWPKTTVGPEFVASLDTQLIKDVHLLVNKPEEQIPAFCEAGAGALSFSIEYTTDISHCLTLIEEGGPHLLRGVSLNPDTSLATLLPYLDQIDFVILLAIGPETGKETFFEDLPSKVSQLRKWKPELLINIDGAITKENVGKVARMGSDFIATGSAIFDGKDPAGNIRLMQAAIHKATS